MVVLNVWWYCWNRFILLGACLSPTGISQLHIVLVYICICLCMYVCVHVIELLVCTCSVTKSLWLYLLKDAVSFANIFCRR